MMYTQQCPDSIKNRLYQAAQGYKGTDSIKEQLLKEALALGLDIETAEAVVHEIVLRLEGTETGKQGNAFGKAHNPIQHKDKLAAIIAKGRF